MDSDKCMFEPPATEEHFRICVPGILSKCSSSVLLRFWVTGWRWWLVRSVK